MVCSYECEQDCGCRKERAVDNRNFNYNETGMHTNGRTGGVSSEMCRVVMSGLKIGSPAGYLIVQIRRVEVQCKSNQ